MDDMARGSQLHVDDGLMSVAALRCRGEADNVAGAYPWRPLRRLVHSSGKMSSRPRNRERNSAISPMMSAEFHLWSRQHR